MAKILNILQTMNAYFKKLTCKTRSDPSHEECGVQPELHSKIFFLEAVHLTHLKTF